ncbi:MAG: GNAT family N-acetyltransferase [bacterium]|nr:GNAT family N-acetyltransferase [bacterium]
MIYYRDETICVRTMLEPDPEIFSREEIAQGWIHATPEKCRRRIQHEKEGMAVALTAEYKGQPAGYVSLYWQPKTGAFAGCGIPEIVDFAVLAKYRKLGVGTKLMDTAEKVAAKVSDRVYLGVGLHKDYGSAQRMYVKRGYIPDGSGVWYRDEVCTPYAPCCNDDDLVLYLSKDLS